MLDLEARGTAAEFGLDSARRWARKPSFLFIGIGVHLARRSTDHGPAECLGQTVAKKLLGREHTAVCPLPYPRVGRYPTTSSPGKLMDARSHAQFAELANCSLDDLLAHL